jgi:hypothetical protein
LRVGAFRARDCGVLRGIDREKAVRLGCPASCDAGVVGGAGLGLR